MFLSSATKTESAGTLTVLNILKAEPPAFATLNVKSAALEPSILEIIRLDTLNTLFDDAELDKTVAPPVVNSITADFAVIVEIFVKLGADIYSPYPKIILAIIGFNPAPAKDAPLVICTSFPASLVKYKLLGVSFFTQSCP